MLSESAMFQDDVLQEARALSEHVRADSSPAVAPGVHPGFGGCVPAAAVRRLVPPPQAGRRGSGNLDAVRPPVVMVVDDDIGMRDSLVMVLENEGLQAVAARHGAEALATLGQMTHLPALIVLDLMMPVMNGWDFRAAQLADAKLARIPTLMLTAAGDADLMQPALGAAEILHKPIDLEVLFDACERLIPGWEREN